MLDKLRPLATFLALVVSHTTQLTDASALAEDETQEPTYRPFLWVQPSFSNDEKDGKASTFHLKRTRFGTKGMVDERVGYDLMLEGISDPKVMQGWIDYILHPLYTIRVGQFKYPFGIEAYPGFIHWKFINPSFVTGGIVKELGRLDPGESSGLFGTSASRSAENESSMTRTPSLTRPC